MNAMSARDWIVQLLVGGLFGALGQSIRVVVGMKKLHDKALHQKQAFSDLFSPSTLALSLLIGFVAGGLGILLVKVDLAAIRTDDIVLLIGIGYAGADFIEAFIRKNLPLGITPEEKEVSEQAPTVAPAPAAALVPAGKADARDLDLLPPVG